MREDEAVGGWLGIPHAKQVTGAGICEQARMLPRVAVPGDELQRIDVTFVQPSKSEAAIADEAKHLRQLPSPRFLAEAGPTHLARDGRSEQTEAREVGDVLARKALIAILRSRTLDR
jgi:hypothetical protein